MLVLLALAALPFVPDTTLVPDTILAKPAAALQLQVPRASAPPVLDGRLDDALWDRAARITDLVQYEPGDQRRASQPSLGYVAYDAEYLYFGFRAYDAGRDRVRATVFPRERGGETDDRVTILIDTFLDNRRAYEFRVTPLGIQADGVKMEGRHADQSVDLVWHSAGQVLDDGWSVEVAIPFASLRFPPGDVLDVGFNVVRVFGRTGEKAAWAPRRRGSPCDICQQGALTGMTGIRRRPTVDLLPYATGAQVGARVYESETVQVDGAPATVSRPREFATGAPQGAVGADVRIALTPAVVLNATLNPDFSQVESDEDQIRVNQRFALFLPERRPFFLEGRDAFRTSEGDGRSELFYSRAIVDPSIGTRLTASVGRYSGGALYARDDAPAYFHYDGHERSGVVGQFGERADVLVARGRRDVLADSYVGVLALGRVAGSSRNAVLASDFSLRLGSVTVSGVGAHSDDVAPDAPEQAAALDGAHRRGTYYRARVARSGRALAWALSASGVSAGFRAQLGRFGRAGVETQGARVQLTQYPDGALLQRTEQSVHVTRTAVHGGGVLDWMVAPRAEFQFRRQTSITVGPHFERVTLHGRALALRGASLDLQSDAAQRVGIGVNVFGGDREIYDPADPRVGTGYFGSVRVTVRPTAAASLEASVQRSNHYEQWGGALVDEATILRLRGAYQFTRALGVRVIGEVSDQFDARASTPATRRAVRYGSSGLLTYELAPASFLYLGYTEALARHEAPAVPTARALRVGSQLFLKVSYLFRV